VYRLFGSKLGILTALLDIAAVEYEKREPGLGTYPIHGLRIGVGDDVVRVEPVGRKAVGVVEPRGGSPTRAEGRVDITDGVRRHILL